MDTQQLTCRKKSLNEVICYGATDRHFKEVVLSLSLLLAPRALFGLDGVEKSYLQVGTWFGSRGSVGRRGVLRLDPELQPY